MPIVRCLLARGTILKQSGGEKQKTEGRKRRSRGGGVGGGQRTAAPLYSLVAGAAAGPSTFGTTGPCPALVRLASPRPFHTPLRAHHPLRPPPKLTSQMYDAENGELRERPPAAILRAAERYRCACVRATSTAPHCIAPSVRMTLHVTLLRSYTRTPCLVPAAL